MANETIRSAAKQAGVKLWEIADYCGVVDSTFSRKLRKELPADMQQNILSAIRTISEKKSGEYLYEDADN